MKILKFIHFRMSESAIEAKLLRYDLLMSGLDTRIIDKVVPPPQVAFASKKPFAVHMLDSVIDEGQELF